MEVIFCLASILYLSLLKSIYAYVSTSEVVVVNFMPLRASVV